MTKVCGWCGQPLDHWGEPPENAETCEQVYGSICQPALDYLSELANNPSDHPDYIDESQESE